MKNTFIRTVLYYAKQFCLATFYGFRQLTLQMLCLVFILWMMYIMEYDDSGTCFFIIAGTLYGLMYFTIPYHWTAVFIPKKRVLTRFVVPYIFCVGLLYLSLFVVQKEAPLLMWAGLATPFICQLFFLLEEYLKKVLSPHCKIFKGIKVACNTITLLPLIALVVVVITFAMGEINRRHRFDDVKTLSRITEVEFPKFKVKDYDRGFSSFHGDYEDELVLEFKQLPTEEFYASIEAMTDCGNWHVDGDSIYRYSRMWGNGMPAPKGEDDEEDMFLNIDIKRGEKQFHVSYGAW